MNLKLLVVILGMMGLVGCVLGPNYATPSNSLPTTSFESARTRVVDSQASIVAPPVKWWEMFGDPVLCEIEERVINENLSIKIAAARVDKSRAQRKISGSIGMPQMGFDTQYLDMRANPNGPHVPPKTANSSTFNSIRSGFDVSWELDVFGRIKRINESADSRVEVTVNDQRFAILSVEAEVARLYISYRGAQALHTILKDSLEVADHSVFLTRTRFSNGVTTNLDVANSEAQKALIESRLPLIEAEQTALINSLSVLIAQPPHTLVALLEKKEDIPSPPSTVPVGIPSELVRRRPDIRRAEANLHAATAEIGIAVADFYPQISLSGGIASETLQLSKLGSWASRQLFIGPIFNLPIFNGGRLKGNLELRKAEQQEAAIHYQQVVLDAWSEVDSTLASFSAEQIRMRSLLAVVQQNEIALKIAQRRYTEGVIDFLNVLAVQKSLLDAQHDLTGSRMAVSQDMIKLYKTLGGGWEEAVPDLRVSTVSQ